MSAAVSFLFMAAFSFFSSQVFDSFILGEPVSRHNLGFMAFFSPCKSNEGTEFQFLYNTTTGSGTLSIIKVVQDY